MMEVYTTEEEQVAALKNWFKENGKALIFGVVLGIAVIAGWQFWRGYQDERAEQASLLYGSLLEALAAKEASVAETKSNTLLTDYSNSPYAALAALLMVKPALADKDYTLAKSRLQFVIDNSKRDVLVQTARLRLIRLHLDTADWAAAKTLLEKNYAAAFNAELQTLWGDWYASQNDPMAARQAYELALAETEVPVYDRQLVEMKRDSQPIANNQSE